VNLCNLDDCGLFICNIVVAIFDFLGLIHIRHFHSQYFDKKILQSKDNFESWMSKGQGKLLTKYKSRYINKINQGMFLRAYHS